MLSRYSRQVLYNKIGEKGQKTLLDSHAAIVGVGALGTVIANNLARAGVGKLTIIDRDFVELSNLQRQTLFTEEDVKNNLPKAEAAVRHLKEINSEIQLEAVVADFNATNAEKLIRDADIILDGTDNFSTRFLINDVALKHNKPWVYGGAVADTGMVMNIIPGVTPCFRCLIQDLPVSGHTQTCDTVGVLNSTTGIIGNIQAVEAIKILLKSEAVLKGVLTINIWQTEFDKFEIEQDKKCPACQQGKYEFLNNRTPATTLLCGQNSIQVLPQQNRDISLPEMANRLQKLGEVEYNRFLLRFKTDQYTITVFLDGRAIVSGTENPGKARSLYAQYIGN